MARAVLLSALLSRIRARADVRSIKFTDAILIDWVNEAVLETLDLIWSACPTYDLKSTDINIVSGQDYVNLPADFYKLHGVRVLDTDSKWKRIERFEWEDQEDLAANLTDRRSLRYCEYGTTKSGTTPSFTWTDVLKFQSKPGWSQSAGLRVYYLPAPAKISDTADGWNFVAGWDEHVVLLVHLRIAAAKQEDEAGIVALLDRQADRIRQRARRRDLANPPRMRDASGDGRRDRTLPRP